jgi:hypothetical protein
MENGKTVMQIYEEPISKVCFCHSGEGRTRSEA